MTEKTTENSNKEQTFAFEAEVSRLMDIVINSLYTDREIFVRELISNAVDALEKIRHLFLVDESLEEKDVPLEIRIEINEKEKQFIISDTGVGMTRDELHDNLGRVAQSGSRDFIDKLAENLKKDVSLIGQFGMGFYSVFMVASRVRVQTRSKYKDDQGYEWSSDGIKDYVIKPMPILFRGTKIILELREDALEFAKEDKIKELIKKYSNFVSFPIYIGEKKVNTVQPLWTKNKQEIIEEDYKEFYKFIAGAYDEPLDYLHFSTDAPLSLHALLFIPRENYERFGFGKYESSIDLHCRKVLIQKQAKEILPNWLRMLKGVVDSEDLPLNISRETMQDNSLVKKINAALTTKFIKHLKEMAKIDGEKYKSFWQTFGSFIKEGIITDADRRSALAPLLRFETSKTKSGELISLDEYISRMLPEQKDIYYLNGSSRNLLEKSPYLEVFFNKGIEVIYTLDPADDFTISHLEKYEEKTFISADSERLDLPEAKPTDKEKGDEKEQTLTDDEINNLKEWMKRVLKDKVADVRVSTRLVESAVMLVNPDSKLSGAVHRLLQAAHQEHHTISSLTLEFNPNHSLIKRIDELRKDETVFPELAIEQLLDQAALTAGYDIEPRSIVDRMNKIMERALLTSA